ncbi:MAG TPA: hypothetical protein DCS29_01930 [Candidatus Magasanikbacteria bacterium]|nr:MAG: hypothetical protein A2479_02815 [Candidatus Magasanikbacteria bacterium RIFOXYC2_FULL_39_8]HAT03517.1 hypothetical protein [Candidatus Magasanikbacteria bacterium]
MPEDQYEIIKDALLDHVRDVFEEIEEDLARYHEEKYAMLEDALNSASDASELQVAFAQWYNDHADDLELEYELEELWQNALANADVDF